MVLPSQPNKRPFAMTLPDHQLVWAEIPVTDLEKGRQFYSAVLDRELVASDSGPNQVVFLPVADDKGGISAHLYPGKPAPEGIGPTVHLLAPVSLEETADRVVEAGGKVLSPAIDIPMGAFIYTLDPDGNSVGWFRFSDS
jgi:uncharacterized protein